MKIRRSNRLVDMTRYLLEHPRSLVSLKFFGERYDSAKSSISEDLGIVKHTFQTLFSEFFFVGQGWPGNS